MEKALKQAREKGYADIEKLLTEKLEELQLSASNISEETDKKSVKINKKTVRFADGTKML